MTYERILEVLDGTLHSACKTFATADITNFVAGDLMSDVLVLDDESFLLITSLNSEQSIRTADIVGARGVLLVNGKIPQKQTLQLAIELDKTLITTPRRMFSACAVLGQNLVDEGRLL